MVKTLNTYILFNNLSFSLKQRKIAKNLVIL